MIKLSVSQLAHIAGVSIRSLHHYDKIGLLKPSERAESRYRYYGKEELFRLQQILFFKELDFPLKEIKTILDDPDFDLLHALTYQRKQLQQRQKRLTTLMQTLDKTIKSLKEDSEMVTEEDMYEGFTPEQVEEYKKEINEKFNSEKIEEANTNIQQMSKGDFNNIKQEQENVAKELSELMDQPVDSDRVQALIKRHHDTNEKFYKIPAHAYRGLADMYVADERFAQFYDKYKPGLSGFIKEAMYYYAEHSLQNR